MGFRKDNRNAREWRKWLLEHQKELDACGLPLLILQDEAHWWDFLMHGYLDHHEDASRFAVSQLSLPQKCALHDFIERNLADDEKHSALILLQLKTFLAMEFESGE